MTLVHSVGMDLVIRIRRASIACQTAPSLAVLDDDDLAHKSVGVIQDALDETADNIAVGRPPVFPLGIDLDQDDIVRSDKSQRAATSCLNPRSIKFQSVAAHQVEELLNTGVEVWILSVEEGIVGDSVYAENRTLKRIVSRCRANERR